MKNRYLIILLSLLTIGITCAIFAYNPQKGKNQGEINLKTPKLTNSHYSKYDDIMAYENGHHDATVRFGGKINHTYNYFPSGNSSYKQQTHNSSLMGSSNRDASKTRDNSTISGIGSSIKSYGITGRPSSSTTLGSPVIGHPGTLLYADAMTKKDITPEEEIIETGNRQNVNLNENPSWLDPWEKAPLGDGIIPAILFGSIWICILYFKNNLI